MAQHGGFWSEVAVGHPRPNIAPNRKICLIGPQHFGTSWPTSAKIWPNQADFGQCGPSRGSRTNFSTASGPGTATIRRFCRDGGTIFRRNPSLKHPFSAQIPNDPRSGLWACRPAPPPMFPRTWAELAQISAKHGQAGRGRSRSGASRGRRGSARTPRRFTSGATCSRRARLGACRDRMRNVGCLPRQEELVAGARAHAGKYLRLTLEGVPSSLLGQWNSPFHVGRAWWTSERVTRRLAGWYPAEGELWPQLRTRWARNL